MIQYRFSVRASDGRPVFASMAYPMYAWLLSQVPVSYGASLHEQGQKPVSQYLYREQASGRFIWTVSCLDEASQEILTPILRGLHEIPLRAGLLKTEFLDASEQSMGDLMESARQQPETSFFRLAFRSPTAFKREGHYVIVPEVPLLVKSLSEKWSGAFPGYPLHDPEALETFRQGLKITDYHLRSCRFSMKNVQIPGFTGEITLKARLPFLMMELWKYLVCFSSFSGIGIKTTLGMGGVHFLP